MKNYRIDLREKTHYECKRCDRSARNGIVDDGICTELRSLIDRLSVRCVGPWAYEKIYRLYMYFGIFASGMKDRWKGLNYIEIGSGPGRCVVRTSGLEIDGSSVAVLRHPSFEFIKQAIYIDNNPDVVDSLNQRIRSLGKDGIAISKQGDYEIEAELLEALNRISDKYLNLVFIDPTQCNVPFNSIRAVVMKLGRADLIINVALGTDIARNLRNAICDPAYKAAKDKYKRFLNDTTLFEDPDIIKRARICPERELQQLFMNKYIQAFAKLGYSFSDYKWVEHYYCLLFLSHSEKGLTFWTKASKINPNNQRELFN
jgi:three-Cys-motif partner protein